MAFRQAGAPARSLIVGNPPNQLTIDTDGIRLPVAIDTPADESTIEWYASIGDAASITALINTLFLQRDLIIEVPDLGVGDQPRLRLEAGGAAGAVQLIGGGGQILNLAAGGLFFNGAAVPGSDVVLSVDESIVLVGTDIEIAAGPAPFSRHAAGVIISEVNTANIGLSTAAVVQTLSAPITTDTNRVYRATAKWTATDTVVATGWDCSVRDTSSNIYGGLFLHRSPFTGSRTIEFTREFLGTGDSRTFRSQFNRRDGTGQMAVFGATIFSQLTIEDIGPA